MRPVFGSLAHHSIKRGKFLPKTKLDISNCPLSPSASTRNHANASSLTRQQR